MTLTTKRLATLLVEELARDEWGDIDLAWLELVAAGDYKPEDAGYGQAAALAQVLDRVVARLDERDTTQGARATRIAASAKQEPPWCHPHCHDRCEPVVETCKHEWSVDEYGTHRCIGCGEPRP